MPTAAAIDLSSVFGRVVERNEDKPAITYEGQTWTYAELDTRILKLANHFKLQGVRQGDRIGYVGQNHPAFLETLFAASALGAIFVPLNFRLSGPELNYIINDAGLHTLVYDGFMQPTVESIQDTLCCKSYLTVEIKETRFPQYDLAVTDTQPLTELTTPAAEDIAFIMYTSGTTGLPKGVMLTHANIFWNDVNLTYIEETNGPVVLTCCPLYHIAGLSCTALAAMFRGEHQILHRAFDPGAVLNDISTYAANVILCVPAMLLFMSQHEDFANTDFSSVKAMLSGGAPVPAPLIKTYQDRGVPFYQVYGLTETAPYALMNVAKDTLTHPEASGKPVFFCDVKIADAEGKELPLGEKGEVCIKGPNVMAGYWNKPDATAKAISEDGWFFSGDVGYKDEDGFFYVNDRKKDMVISGGENVYPAEVEAVIYEHEAIAEVAVIGLPDEKWGEAVTAVIAFKEGQKLSLEQLRSFCENKLARYKIPLRLHEIDALPRNPSGKILKYQLREQFQSETANAA